MNKLTNYTTEKIFIRLINNKSNENYWKYIQELRKRKTDAIYKKSLLLIDSNSIKEKIIGLDVLNQFGYPRLHQKEIIQLFFKLLKSETDKEVLSSILYGISHNNESLTNEQVDFLCSLKTHKSVYVKFSLVNALLTLENDNAIDTLIEFSKNKDFDIRNWATFGLGSQTDIDNEKIRFALWNRIKDTSKIVRQEAIAGLAQRKDKNIKDILIQELKNIDEYSSLILDSIEEFNDKSLIPYLENQIEENKTSKKVNEEWLVDTLKKLKSANQKN